MLKYVLMVITFITTVVINALANVLPFNQVTTAEVSFKYPSYFTPENYVFSIWGLIYLSLAFMLVKLGLSLEKNKKFVDKVYIWFSLANLLNAVWMFTWHFEFLMLSVFVMLMLLFSLVKCYLVTREFKSKLKAELRFPVSLYLGWISVATIANISSFLAFKSFSFLVSDITYTILMMYVALALGVLMYKKEKDFVFSLVIIWAIVGILVNFYTITEILVFGLIGLIVAVLAALYFDNRTKTNGV